MNSKMKLFIQLLLILLLITLFGCNNNRNGSLVKNVLKDGINGSKEETVETVVETTSVRDRINNPYDNIDVDLTTMPKTLSYSTASRMNMMSEQYLGQIVKISGVCSVFYDEKSDHYYYTCLIDDETLCCTLGIEFELIDEYKFPDEYPKDEDEVTVVGVFDHYKEGATTYKTLRKAVLL